MKYKILILIILALFFYIDYKYDLLDANKPTILEGQRPEIYAIEFCKSITGHHAINYVIFAQDQHNDYYEIWCSKSNETNYPRVEQ